MVGHVGNEREEEYLGISYFPQRLKGLREQRRISQQVLADFCEISKSTIARYENGEQDPTARTICKISDFFDVSVDYLLGRKNFF